MLHRDGPSHDKKKIVKFVIATTVLRILGWISSGWCSFLAAFSSQKRTPVERTLRLAGKRNESARYSTTATVFPFIVFSTKHGSHSNAKEQERVLDERSTGLDGRERNEGSERKNELNLSPFFYRSRRIEK